MTEQEKRELAKRVLAHYREQRAWPFCRAPKYARISAIVRGSRDPEQTVFWLSEYNHYWKWR